jgi:hypothetical protein
MPVVSERVCWVRPFSCRSATRRWGKAYQQDLGAYSASRNNPVLDILLLRFMPNRIFPISFADVSGDHPDYDPLLRVGHTYNVSSAPPGTLVGALPAPLKVMGATLNSFTIEALSGHPEGAGSKIT